MQVFGAKENKAGTYRLFDYCPKPCHFVTVCCSVSLFSAKPNGHVLGLWLRVAVIHCKKYFVMFRQSLVSFLVCYSSTSDVSVEEQQFSRPNKTYPNKILGEK